MGLCVIIIEWAITNNGSSASGLLNITHLRLEGNKLTGKLPDEWVTGAVPLIEVLNISSNKLSGKLPVSWSAEHLQHLDLSNNNFTGLLPTQWATSSDLRSLTSLALAHNSLSGEHTFHPHIEHVCTIKLLVSRCSFYSSYTAGHLSVIIRPAQLSGPAMVMN